MKNGFKRALSMLLCLTMVLGLFCYAPEASALVDSSGYECTGSVEQLLRASSDAVAGQCDYGDGCFYRNGSYRKSVAVGHREKAETGRFRR